MDVMKYSDALKYSMNELAKDKRFIFLGYNVKFGSKAYNTLSEVPKEQIIETPLAENLMIGLAMGLSLEGFVPIVFFERHDFMLIALDGIVNHLDKIKKMSYGEYEMPMIIRANIGSRSPIDAGLQHTQNFSEVFRKLVSFPVYEPKNPREVIKIYRLVKNTKCPVMVIEHKDWYNEGG